MSHCSVISDTDAKALPYLQACIKENLRMHPPFAGGLVKEVPKGGDTVNGTFIPEGTNVQVCIWGIQRNKVYGEKPDVDIYRPERWLDADTEQVKQMEKMLDFIFGYGRISCLGKGVAMIEIGKVLFEVSMHYF